MKGIKSALITILAIGLLAGTAVGVAAQDEEADPMAPAWVTGTVVFGSNDLPGEVTADTPAAITEGIGYSNTMEASDPRLSGAATYTGNWQQYLGAGGMQVQAGSHVVTNDEGRWVGTGTALVGPGFDSDVVTLHGEGAYEGLTAHVFMDWTTQPASFNAAIFPGEMPSPPEPRTAE